MRDAPSAKSVGLLCLCSRPGIIWYGIQRGRFGRLAAATLEHLLCLHCGYDIRGLPTDPADSVTIGPECGCAWHLHTDGAAGERDDDCAGRVSSAASRGRTICAGGGMNGMARRRVRRQSLDRNTRRWASFGARRGAQPWYPAHAAFD